MHRLLRWVRNLSDERKSALATVVSAGVTFCIAAVWAVHFFGFTQGSPATAVGALEEDGALGGLFDQVTVLIDEIKTAQFTPPAIEYPTDLDQAN